jgi:hypothetical protein
MESRDLELVQQKLSPSDVALDAQRRLVTANPEAAEVLRRLGCS